MTQAPYLFISHSSYDNDVTRQIVEALKSAGIPHWVDFHDIKDGQQWLHEIKKGLEGSSAILIVMSREAQKSDWVEREALFALRDRLPMFIALLEEMPLPLHLIDRQYTPCWKDLPAGINNLKEAVQKALADKTSSKASEENEYSPEPTENNFFQYMAQLPHGDNSALIAQDLYHWGKLTGDEVEFGGKLTPGFHVRIKLNSESLIVFSVWAYSKTPSVQIPFDYLLAYAPYDKSRLRLSTLKSLNQLLPNGENFDAGKADRRPSLALRYLNSAEKLETFKQIISEIIDNLRSA